MPFSFRLPAKTIYLLSGRNAMGSKFASFTSRQQMVNGIQYTVPVLPASVAPITH